MIKFPSNVKEYVAYWSADSAFIQLADDASEDAQKEHEHKWKVARETGDYSSLRVEGSDEPTAFTLRPLSADALNIIAAAVEKGLPARGGYVLAFQWALKDIAMKGIEIAFTDHPQLGRISALTMFDKLGVPAGFALRIASELGQIAFSKATPSPNY